MLTDHGVLYALVLYSTGFLLIVMLIRMILSWVGIDERVGIVRFLYKITEPFIRPIRRFCPPIGRFDISFILAFFLLITLQTLLLQSLPAGW
jgi:YggT family protein